MREWVQAGCLWGIVLLGVLSLCPFRFRSRWTSWNLYLPFLALLAYGLYETILPEEIDVRGQMSILLPALFFVWLNGIAKVALLAIFIEKAGGSRRALRRLPQRTAQLLASLLVAAGCGIWVWTAIP